MRKICIRLYMKGLGSYLTISSMFVAGSLSLLLQLLLQGRYARICIEVPLEKPLKTHVHIGTHKQVLLYEGLNILCTRCGRFGHASWSYQFFQTPPLNSIPTTPTNTSHPSSTTFIPSTKKSEWKTVSFPKRTNARYNKYNQRNQTDEPHNLQLADQIRKGKAVDMTITQVTPDFVTVDDRNNYIGGTLHGTGTSWTNCIVLLLHIPTGRGMRWLMV
uniref:Uncharacterized protein n=1 Tax=Nicotiana tabacum TaxID=4097 RepID=A0A1S3X911_TOBAC|nr:PREDICTED: uncharacterized protein LOC107762406 [Nicotiana tabacum]